MTVRELTEKDVDFSVEALPEDIPLEGNLCAHEGDEECYAKVRDQLERGNEWAWCTVRVTAQWKGYEGTAYLGGCSYKSEKDFSSPDGYLPDLKREALEDLNRTVERAALSLEELLELEIPD